MPSLPDKSIDYCFTDLPFNVKINSNRIGIDGKSTISNKKIMYKDDIINYENFCKLLLNELERICNGVFLYCGIENLPMWCQIKKPKGILFLNVPNSNSRGKITAYMHIRPILYYGKIKKKLKTDYYNYLAYIGFSRKRATIKNLIHPCPIIPKFWFDIILEISPKSVIDPFIGSGTTAEVCIKLGIPYIGYEINSIYKHDMDLRISKGMSCIKSPRNVSYWFKNEEKNEYGME